MEASEMSEDNFRKVIGMIKEDPNLSDFQKEQLIKALTKPDSEMNEDAFLSQFPPDVKIFLIEHLPYPIPRYLRKLEDLK